MPICNPARQLRVGKDLQHLTTEILDHPWSLDMRSQMKTVFFVCFRILTSLLGSNHVFFLHGDFVQMKYILCTTLSI